MRLEDVVVDEEISMEESGLLILPQPWSLDPGIWDRTS